MNPLVAPLLLLGVLRHYSWEWFPPEIQGQAWNAASSIVIVLFLLATKIPQTKWVVIWWIAE